MIKKKKTALADNKRCWSNPRESNRTHIDHESIGVAFVCLGLDAKIIQDGLTQVRIIKGTLFSIECKTDDVVREAEVTRQSLAGLNAELEGAVQAPEKLKSQRRKLEGMKA